MNKAITICTPLLVLIIFAIHHSPLQAQNKITITGKVTNKFTGVAVAGAHVWVEGKATGTVADSNGLFDISVEKISGDRLVVSGIGLKSAKISIEQAAKSSQIQPIKLEPYGNIPNDVRTRLMALSPKEVFDKAVRNLRTDNGYPTNSFELKAFYREIQNQNGRYSSLIETFVKINDNRVTKAMDDLQVLSKKKVYGNPEIESDMMKVDYFGNLNMLLNLVNGHTMNVVQHANRIKPGKKNESGWGNRDYIIKELTYYHDRLAYVLLYNSTSGLAKFELIIDAEDFVFLRNEFVYSLSDTTATDKYLWKENDENDTECGLYHTGQIFEFRRFEGSLYPFYFVRDEKRSCYSISNKKITWSDGARRELLFFDISTTNLNQLTKPLDKDEYLSLYSQLGDIQQAENLSNLNYIKNSQIDELDQEQFLKLEVR